MYFGRAFHLILMHIYILYSMLWGKLSKIRLIFLKSCFFPEFRLIQSDFRSIEILFKKFSEPLLVQLIEPIFRSIEHNVSGFFKNSSLTDSNIFFKSFLKLFSFSPTWQANTKIFCRFLPKFLQGFPPSRPIRPFYPSFCSYFHVFMHLKGIFGPF